MVPGSDGCTAMRSPTLRSFSFPPQRSPQPCEAFVTTHVVPASALASKLQFDHAQYPPVRAKIWEPSDGSTARAETE